MEVIDYERKYKKYKAKYLELKNGGGGKKLTFAKIKKKFDELIKANKKLYFKRYANAVDNEKLEIIEISEQENKGNKYLRINHLDVGKESKNKGKENSDSVNKANMFPFGEATYNLNILKDSENYVLQYCLECKGIAA